MRQLSMKLHQYAAPARELPAGYEIRTFRPGDREALKDAVIALTIERMTDEKLDEKILCHAGLVPAESLFIVWHGEKPVGTACGYLTPEAGKGTLHMVSVLASESGHGLGMLVCAKAIEWLIGQKTPVIDLTTDDFRLPAVMSYLRLGYLPVIDDEEMLTRWRNVFAQLGVAEKRAFRSLQSAAPEEIL